MVRGDGTTIGDTFAGTLELKLRGNTDVGVPFTRVYVKTVHELAINLFSLHPVQAKHSITVESAAVHLFGGNITFSPGAAGSFFHATRLPPSHRVKIAAVTVVPPPSSFTLAHY